MFERFFGMHEAHAAPERCFARRPGLGGPGGGPGFWDRFQGGPRGGFGRGFGGGRERLFEGGDVKLVVLKLLSEQPSYGYQLIKTMEQRLAGGYTPSAGVIYPTLTMLEEEGLTSSSTENNKKVYAVTQDGLAFLEANKDRLSELFERMDEAGKGFQRGRSPEIMRAFMELRSAAVARLSSGQATPELTKKIAQTIRAAAQAIQEL
ncbi:PadR family transcriptional regulator [Paludibaculum fermentans]|uniref:PadR family transcriptional regulator n=1 Tax=Paludibaculum fermentans TaxID=1473598 RepID=A0A7S7NW82_PALFE|nr:PadR family transcriptional regulator [Paludibaculum fermentans]QOY90927.1 PadR family transcriptional regulator [Paludibaculum fermentans]